MRCLAGMCHAPAPPHHLLLPRANSCLALCPNPTVLTLRNRTSDPDTFSILSLLAFHHFVVSTPAFSNSSHVSFHGVRAKTFSTHVITKIAPAVRETGLFTHGRASLNFTIIPMCTTVSQSHVHAVSGSDVPCPCTTAPLAPLARELLSCPVS